MKMRLLEVIEEWKEEGRNSKSAWMKKMRIYYANEMQKELLKIERDMFCVVYEEVKE